MRVHSMLPIAAVVLASSLISTHGTPETLFRKDKAAVMLYGGMLDTAILIAEPDTANLVDIALLRIKGATVSPGELEERPCVGLALFTRDEWFMLERRGVPASEIRPDMARLHVRFFPAYGTAPAVVHDPGADGSAVPFAGARSKRGDAWIALGARQLVRTSIPTTAEVGTPIRCDPLE